MKLVTQYPEPWGYESFPGHRTYDIIAANGAYIGKVETEEVAQAICTRFGGGGRIMSIAEQFVAVPV